MNIKNSPSRSYCIAIKGSIRGTSREKIYYELGLESLRDRRWYRKLTTFYKIFTIQAPPYLFKLIPVNNNHYITRSTHNIPPFQAKHNFFKNTFFPSSIKEWNILDASIRNAESFSVFKKQILTFIRPSPNSVFNCHHPQGLKFLTRLRLGLSHLRKHKFNHNFQDSVNPICKCGQEFETTSHFLLHCPLYSDVRKTFLNKIKSIKSNLIDKNDSNLVNILLYGDMSLTTEINPSILNSTIDFLLESRRFEKPLL